MTESHRPEGMETEELEMNASSPQQMPAEPFDDDYDDNGFDEVLPVAKPASEGGWPSLLRFTNAGGAPFLSRTLRQGWEAKLSMRKSRRLILHFAFSKMATLPLIWMGMARSGALSLLKSPAAMEKPPWKLMAS